MERVSWSLLYQNRKERKCRKVKMKIKTKIETSKFINEKYKEKKGKEKCVRGGESEDPSLIPHSRISWM